MRTTTKRTTAQRVALNNTATKWTKDQEENWRERTKCNSQFSVFGFLVAISEYSLWYWHECHRLFHFFQQIGMLIHQRWHTKCESDHVFSGKRAPKFWFQLLMCSGMPLLCAVCESVTAIEKNLFEAKKITKKKTAHGQHDDDGNNNSDDGDDSATTTNTTVFFGWRPQRCLCVLQFFQQK